MELIAEILVELLAWLLQIVAELLLQVFGEAIAELIGHAVKAPFQRRPVPAWLAAIGYAIFGAIAGAISLGLLPELFVRPEWLRVLNLLLTPVLAGLLMAALGAWRRRRDGTTIRLDSFFHGYCFALAMALVRYAFGD